MCFTLFLTFGKCNFGRGHCYKLWFDDDCGSVFPVEDPYYARVKATCPHCSLHTRTIDELLILLSLQEQPLEQGTFTRMTDEQGLVAVRQLVERIWRQKKPEFMVDWLAELGR